MNYRLMFIVNAVVALLFGLGFLVVPSIVLKQFGVDEYASTRMVAQFFGAALLTIGLLAWFSKNITDAGTQKGMGIAFLAGAVVGLIVTVLGVATSVLRSKGWLAMAIYVLFALGYAYLMFLKRESSEASE